MSFHGVPWDSMGFPDFPNLSSPSIHFPTHLSPLSHTHSLLSHHLLCLPPCFPDTLLTELCAFCWKYCWNYSTLYPCATTCTARLEFTIKWRTSLSTADTNAFRRKTLDRPGSNGTPPHPKPNIIALFPSLNHTTLHLHPLRTFPMTLNLDKMWVTITTTQKNRFSQWQSLQWTYEQLMRFPASPQWTYTTYCDDYICNYFLCAPEWIEWNFLGNRANNQ